MAVVLLVEDEEILRRSMARALERLPDVHIVQAGTLAQARALLADEAPSMVVSDLSLPDGCAVDLLADIERAGRPVPVVFVSAWLGRFRDQIPRRSDIEVFDKPLPMETLRQRVSEHLAQRRASAPTPFGVSDYLQLAAMGRHTMLLRVYDGRTQVGHMTVIRGEVWQAHHGVEDGEPAARALVVAAGLRVEIDPYVGDPGPRTVHQGVDHLLLDAFRLHDEASRPPGWTDAEATQEWPGPQAVAAARDTTAQVDQLLDEGLDALLARDYLGAWIAFSAADTLRPGDPVVRANLNRIREMGYAPADG